MAVDTTTTNDDTTPSQDTTKGAVPTSATSSADAPKTTAPDRETRRMAALKFTEDGRPATLAELGDARRDLSRNERIKLEKAPFNVWDDIVQRYSKEGFDSISEDDMERFKWYGVYQQRPKTDPFFMMRLKVPAGNLSATQMRAVASVTRDHARGIADISTRQNFQMHWLTIETIPDVVRRLLAVGLTTKGACGDVSRNICGSPLAGLDPDEVIDPTALIHEAHGFFVDANEYADLPRKHKMLVVGNPAMGQTEINGLALYGVRREDDGSVGYGIRVGGGLSTEPHIAQDLSVFIAPEQALEVLKKVAEIYRNFGYRKNRKHARLKYLVADWGAAKFRAKLEELMGVTLRDAENTPSIEGYRDRLGVHDQVQPGLQWIGVPVVAGRLTSDQVDAIADLSEEFGSGETRLTVMQSFYLVNIPREKVPQVLMRLEAIGLPVEDTSAIRRGIVACTGIEFCNLAVTETKGRAGHLVELLDASVKWSESDMFRINVNGCPNSCGQHWLADVGLQGCTKKVDGELKEHFDVFLGGALGTSASGGPRFNRRVKRVPAEEVAPAITRAIGHYQSRRKGEETFADFCARHSEEELAELL